MSVEQAVETTYQRVVAAPAGSGGRAEALVGHWRNTEILGGGDFSQVTDSNLVLDGDGRFAMWSKSAGSGGTSESERTEGGWKTDGGVLYLRADGGSDWEEVGRFQVSGDTLLMTASDGKRVYNRV